MAADKQRPGGILARLLCVLGFHDFRIVDVSFEFGSDCKVEKLQCRRCGATVTKQM